MYHLLCSPCMYRIDLSQKIVSKNRKWVAQNLWKFLLLTVVGREVTLRSHYIVQSCCIVQLLCCAAVALCSRYIVQPLRCAAVALCSCCIVQLCVVQPLLCAAVTLCSCCVVELSHCSAAPSPLPENVAPPSPQQQTLHSRLCTLHNRTYHRSLYRPVASIYIYLSIV